MKIRNMLRSRHVIRQHRAMLVEFSLSQLFQSFGKKSDTHIGLLTYSQIAFRSLGGHEYGYHDLPNQIHGHAKLNNLSYTDYGRLVKHHYESHVDANRLNGYNLT